MDVGANPQFEEKLRVNVLLLQFKGLSERNLNMRNELNFSEFYRSVNYIGSRAK